MPAHLLSTASRPSCRKTPVAKPVSPHYSTSKHLNSVSEDTRLKISQKGLYALEALMTLGQRYGSGTIKIREIAIENNLPEKFLELILIELKNARIVESVRGAKGGYQLRRPPSEIYLGEIVRLIDGPLAPFGDADQLRRLIESDSQHRSLYEVFLRVRDEAAKILENTTVADLVKRTPDPKRGKTKKGQNGSAMLSVVDPEATNE